MKFLVSTWVLTIFLSPLSLSAAEKKAQQLCEKLPAETYQLSHQDKNAQLSILNVTEAHRKGGLSDYQRRMIREMLAPEILGSESPEERAVAAFIERDGFIALWENRELSLRFWVVAYYSGDEEMGQFFLDESLASPVLRPKAMAKIVDSAIYCLKNN